MLILIGAPGLVWVLVYYFTRDAGAGVMPAALALLVAVVAVVRVQAYERQQQQQRR